jgi:serine/threonine protein kinase
LSKKNGKEVNQMSDKSTQVIRYGDIAAHLFVWQKAFFLAPIWAIPIIPLIGFVCRAMGNSALQVGYALVLCVCLTYLFEDLLKRRIRLTDEFIFFGFKALPIRDIATVDLVYKKNKLFPEAMRIISSSGRRIQLKLNGLTDDGLRALLKHLETRNSNVDVGPVLAALTKKRTLKRKTTSTQLRLEMPYRSRQLVDEVKESFVTTAKKWAQVGPLIATVALAPCWLSIVSSWYLGLQAHTNYNMQASLNLNETLGKIANGLLIGLVWKAADASEQLGFLMNPVVIGMILCALGTLVIYMIRTLCRPNCLVADAKGISLMLRLGELFTPLNMVRWDDITSVSMEQRAAKSGQMKIVRKNGKAFTADLKSIAAEDRALLLARLEKKVPDIQIDHALSQSMRPRSERSYTEIWLQSLNQSPDRQTLLPLQPGQTVGDNDFEVLRSLGVGGQGTAYLCRSVSNDQVEVVLKETIIPVFVDDAVRRNAIERFEQESRLLRSLEHDGIVKLLDCFIEDHRAYFVLEHIDGANLRDMVLRDGPLPVDQVRYLALQMCGILKFLHSRSVVHRDFTPDNVLLNSRGELKLIDFNVAQYVQAGTTGTIVGKHAYLPPEQFRGKATAQSDLYAFGATLFFLLTGKDPEPISQSSARNLNPDVPQALDEIIKKATALQPSARYQSAEEIENALLTLTSETFIDIVQPQTTSPEPISLSTSAGIRQNLSEAPTEIAISVTRIIDDAVSDQASTDECDDASILSLRRDQAVEVK